MTSEKTVHVDGAELHAQRFGGADDPAILLIQGGASAMDWWEDDFCQQLVEGGHQVIRYDNRDTGQSTSYPPGQPGYTRRDLVNDALAVLDAFAVDRAHVVGLSMGASIAQTIALDHPGRVRSLTLISTSPVTPPADGVELPPMSDELAAVFADESGAEPDWSDRTSVVDYVVDSFRPFAGSGPFDEAGLRAVAEQIVDRSRSMASANNHFMADFGPKPSRTLQELTTPTLVIHGAEDPLFPLPHGEALAVTIPDAHLVVLAATGHELPRRTWDVALPAILTHTTRSP
jgi:pimeloyl-ACP methyl ester carboxylesterase